MVAEKVFAVIAESTRRDILEALAQESKAVGQLVDELGVSQPTVSKHLRVLREAGVVTMRAQGQKRFYGINTEPLTMVSSWLDSLGAGAPAAAPAKKASVTAIKPVDVEKKPVPAAAPVAETASSLRPAVKTQTVKTQAAEVSVPKPAASTHPTPVRPGAPVHVAARAGAVLVPINDGDNAAPNTLSRSVGRAANKAADLLANLPTLPTFKRRKN